MAEVDGNSRFQNLCRLCATKTSLVLAINIFESEGAIRQIAKKIQSCLPVQIHEADELPKMVCENCIYKLDLLCDFRDRSMRTERLLLDLFKEINTSRLQTEQEQISVVTMNQNDLIMVQHHQLLNEANLQNVNEIDLAHLGAHRDSMIVEHEIILSHHSLDNIDLNNHELTNQDLSNPSLQTQDGILVGTRNAQRHIEPPRFGEDNLSLMQPEHHLLSYMDNENAVNVNDIHLSSNMKNHSYNAAYEAKIVLMESPNTSNNNFTETKPELSEVNSPESSSNSLLVEETATSLNMTDKQVYVIENNSNEETVQLNGNVSDVKGWYCCNICNKGFDHKLDFDEHYDVHFPKCPTCLALFTTEETLNEHIKVAHVVNTEEPVKTTRLKRATLPLKSESNSEESDMEADTGAVEEEEEIDDPIPNDSNSNKRKKWSPKVCTECGKTYNSNYKLTEHMRKHTGEKPYKCSSCEKAFRSKIGLAQHEAKHTGQYDYSCSTCGKGFQCKSYLMVHQRVHSDVKPYPCTTCGQNFKTKQSLLDHTNRHLGVKPYMCEICGRGFITKGLCKAHQKVHSGLDNRKYPCKICSKMFVSKSYLQTHLRIHTGEKPFKCEVCGKGFLTRVDLRIHSTLHTGEKSYVCEMCGKAFARRDALRCHRRSHTGERPYSCDLCGQTFTQFTPMAIHKRLHTGERPYACEPCGKTFVSKSTMMAHTKKHVR